MLTFFIFFWHFSIIWWFPLFSLHSTCWIWWSTVLDFTRTPIAPFTLNTGCFLNSVIYDLALIQSFFGIFEIGMTFFHSIHRRILKNAKTLLIGQILVWKNFPQTWPFFADYYKNVLGKNYESHQICLFIMYFIIISYSVTTNNKIHGK